MWSKGTRPGLCQSVYTRFLQISFSFASHWSVSVPVGYILSSILNHRTRCSCAACAPTYTVPETVLRSGPAVVVNLADWTFSGRREFRNVERLAGTAPCSS